MIAPDAGRRRRRAAGFVRDHRRPITGLLAAAASLIVFGNAFGWRTASPQSRGGDAGAGIVSASGQERRRDRGIGILFFDRRPGADTRAGNAGARVPSDTATADTIVILRDTTGRQVVARFIMRTAGMSWSFALETREDVERASLEFDYEIEGLPIDLVTPDERWIRAIYGTAADGSTRLGWVRLTPGLTRYTSWRSVLPEQPLFFDAGITPEFFGSVRGQPSPFVLERGANGLPDYIMHPMEVRGDWMQVRVTTPSDMCAAPTSVRQGLLWIRFLSDSGRPRVWFHTRGC